MKSGTRASAICRKRLYTPPHYSSSDLMASNQKARATERTIVATVRPVAGFVPVIRQLVREDSPVFAQDLRARKTSASCKKPPTALARRTTLDDFDGGEGHAERSAFLHSRLRIARSAYGRIQ